MLEQIHLVNDNIQFYELVYFSLDKPVPYHLKCDQIIEIKPIMVEDATLYLYSADILKIDKNSLGSVEAIQMSYLKYLQKMVFPDNEQAVQKFVNVLNLCLDLQDVYLCNDERDRAFLKAGDIIITAKEFDEIKQIILYQNDPRFDDQYINPDIKRAMEDVDRLKNKDYESPSFERKCGIIEAHTGILKEQLLKKTWRSFQILFDEVCGEIEFYTVRPAAVAVGAGDKVDHYIFKKKKDKFDGYFVDPDKFNKSIGGKGQSSIRTVVGADSTAQYADVLSQLNK